MSDPTLLVKKCNFVLIFLIKCQNFREYFSSHHFGNLNTGIYISFCVLQIINYNFVYIIIKFDYIMK
jgi:hypothetical protein